MSEIREKIESFLHEGINDPSIFKAIFLAGGPGSGKSFVAGKTTGGQGFRVVNSDELLELMLKKAGLGLDLTKMTPDEARQKDAIRDLAKAKTAKKLDLLLKGRLGLVIDGTGKDFNKINKQKENLQKLGYDTFMIFVNTNLDTALERNQMRKRTVPEDIVKKSWKKVQDNIGKFQQAFNGNFIVVDNNTNVPDEKLFTKVFKEVKKFAKRPPANIIAKKWIKSEKERRGIK